MHTAVESHTPTALLPPPAADAVPMHTLDTVSYASRGHSPLSSPRTPQRRPQNMNLSVSPAHSQGPVVSPRPMLSPKHSFSVDPFTKATQVEQLERIAAQADSENADMSRPGGSPAARDKTLPRVPQETLRASLTPVRQKVDNLFPPEGPSDHAPPTPTLAALTSLKVSRNHLSVGGELSGLDALEAKLLAEVGTRKAESSERRPDVRSVMPIAIPRPTKADPANDSAISSLTLPGLDEEANPLHSQQPLEAPQQLLEPPSHVGDDSDDDRALTERRVSRKSKENVKSSSSTATHKSKGKSKDKERHNGKRSGGNGNKDEDIHRMRKTAHGRVAAWLGSIEPDAPPQSGTPPPVSPMPVADLSDVVREDAQGRVAAWLGYMQTAGAPHSTRPPGPKPASNDDGASEHDEQKPDDAKHASVPPRQTQQAEEAEVETPRDVSAAPNPRSSGFMPVGTYRAQKQQRRDAADAARGHASPWLAVYPPQHQGPEVRYDIRSARGGKGGKVTSVAAIWASATQDKPETPKPTNPPKDVARLRDIQPVKKAINKTSPQAMSKPSPRNPLAKNTRAGAFTANSDNHSTPMSAADLTARRTRAIKATSVPAMVSSSLATPMLSSTASLARPTPAITDRRKDNKLNITHLAEVQTSLPTVQTSLPTVKEDPPSAVAKGDLAFGQARLRELIKRYQGQTS